MILGKNASTTIIKCCNQGNATGLLIRDDQKGGQFDCDSFEECGPDFSLCSTMLRFNYTSIPNNTLDVQIDFGTGCWSATHYPECQAEKCILDYSTKFKRGSHSASFCCCNTSFCNTQFIAPVGRKFPLDFRKNVSRNRPDEDVPMNDSNPILYGLFPIFFVLLAVACFFCFRKFYGTRSVRRKKHWSRDQDVSIERRSLIEPGFQKWSLSVKNQSKKCVPVRNSIPTTLSCSLVGNLLLEKETAHGGFGRLWKARMDDKLCAIKRFSERDKESWRRECLIYSTQGLEHSNILKYFGNQIIEKSPEFDGPEYRIVCEYHAHGSLQFYLKRRTVSYKELIKICEEMMAGLAHLHSYSRPNSGNVASIAHRDFKSSNILLKDDLTPCIADFGLARAFLVDERVDNVHAQVGTARYMAPEVLDGAITFTAEAFLRIDVYAASLVLWEILRRCEAPCGDDSNDPTGVPVHSSSYQLPFEAEVGMHAPLPVMVEAVRNSCVRPVSNHAWMSWLGLRVLWETVTECWDEDAEARLSAHCAWERLQRLRERHYINIQDRKGSQTSLSPGGDFSSASSLTETTLSGVDGSAEKGQQRVSSSGICSSSDQEVITSDSDSNNDAELSSDTGLPCSLSGNGETATDSGIPPNVDISDLINIPPVKFPTIFPVNMMPYVKKNPASHVIYVPRRPVSKTLEPAFGSNPLEFHSNFSSISVDSSSATDFAMSSLNTEFDSLRNT